MFEIFLACRRKERFPKFSERFLFTLLGRVVLEALKDPSCDFKKHIHLAFRQAEPFYQLTVNDAGPVSGLINILDQAVSPKIMNLDRLQDWEYT